MYLQYVLWWAGTSIVVLYKRALIDQGRGKATNGIKNKRYIDYIRNVYIYRAISIYK